MLTYVTCIEKRGEAKFWRVRMFLGDPLKCNAKKKPSETSEITYLELILLPRRKYISLEIANN